MGYLSDVNNKFLAKELSLCPKFENAEFMLELSNICNHHCVFCQHSKMTRKQVEMKEPLVFRLLKEAAELGMTRVGLMMTGEPFVSRHLADYIAYAKKCGFTYVFVTTNGSLASPQRLAEVFDAGLDSIKFSINAGSPATYRRIHGSNDYERVVENLKFAYKYRKEKGLHYKILSSYVATTYTIDEIDKHYALIKNYIDDFAVFEMNNRAGENLDVLQKYYVRVDGTHAPVSVRTFCAPCTYLFNAVHVTCEGYLTLCCAEALNMVVVEDLNKMSLKKAWHSERMQEMRKRHLQGQLEGLQCYNCIHNVITPVEPINKTLYQACQVKGKSE